MLPRKKQNIIINHVEVIFSINVKVIIVVIGLTVKFIDLKNEELPKYLMKTCL